MPVSDFAFPWRFFFERRFELAIENYCVPSSARPGSRPLDPLSLRPNDRVAESFFLLISPAPSRADPDLVPLRI